MAYVIEEIKENIKLHLIKTDKFKTNLLSAFLTAINIYDNIAKYAGAGTIVPITGFANSIVSPAMEFKSEGYVLGTGAKMFTIAGPVLVYGISTSIIIGIISFLSSLNNLSITSKLMPSS